MEYCVYMKTIRINYYKSLYFYEYIYIYIYYKYNKH